MKGDFSQAAGARPGLTAVFALAAGIAAGRAGEMDPFTAALAMGALAASIYLAQGWVRTLLAGAALLGLALILHHDWSHPADQLRQMGLFGRPVAVVAEFVTADSERPNNVRVYFRIRRINGTPVSTMAMANAPYSHPLAAALPGDVFMISGLRLIPIHGFQNQGGWDYERYMADQGIGARALIRKKTKMFQVDRSRSVARIMEEARRESSRRLAAAIRDPQALAVTRAILTGDQGLVTPELRDIFSRAGTAHILSVSGLHVGFVGGAVYLALRTALFAAMYPLRRRWAAAGAPMRLAGAMAIPVVGLFLLFTGPSIPALRAGIMIGVYLGAVAMGRPKEFYSSFAAAMAVILAWTPWALFTLSFQLSFTAVYFITVFLESWLNAPEGADPQARLAALAPGWGLRALNRFPMLGSALVSSVFATLGAGPLVAFHFHTVPVLGPLINAPVVILGSVATPLGLAGLIAGSDTLMGWAAWLSYLIVAISWLGAEIPGAYFYVTIFPAAACALLYVALGCAVIMRPGRGRAVACGGLALAAALAVAGGRLDARMETGMRVRFLDVGQGDCTLISWPGGAAMVDAGMANPLFDTGRMVAAPALWRLGKGSLDALFVTHGDNDHIGGAMGLLDRTPAAMVYGPGVAQAQPALAQLRGWAMAAGKYRPLKKGDTVGFPGGPAVTILNPPVGRTPFPATVNNSSLAMKVTYGAVSFILLSDAGDEVEREMARDREMMKAQVLKVAHHGSGRSSAAALLDAVRPEYAVISVGRDNSHGHPAQNTLERLATSGARVFRTDLDGEVVFWTDGRVIKATTFSSGGTK